jgi:WD40 repeat protein
MNERLPERNQSRAVLIGTGSYTWLKPVPAALNSLKRFHETLIGDLCGWSAENVAVIADERDRGDLPDRLVRHFSEARDVALFYFVGHGQVAYSPSGDSLCLGLVDSRSEPLRRRTTSLGFDTVRHALEASNARTKIVILDCCYAGLEAPNRLSAGDVLDLTRGSGAYTLAATGEFSEAWFETGISEPETYFTKYLLDVIDCGLPAEGPLLPIEAIFRAAAEALEADGKPVPTSRMTGHATRSIFAWNVISAGLEPRLRPSRGRRREFPRRSVLAAFITAPIAAAAGVVYWTSSPRRLAPVLTGHTNTVWSVAFSPDSRLLASTSWDKTARVWDVAKRRSIATLSGHTGIVHSVAFAPDGRTLATGSDDRTVRVWNVLNGTAEVTLTGYLLGVYPVAFNPAGRILATGDDYGEIRLWNPAILGDPPAIMRGHTKGVYALAFSPDQQLLASAGWDGVIRLWDLNTLQLKKELKGDGTTIWTLAFSPDSHTLASAGWGGKVKLWDLATYRIAGTLAVGSWTIYAIAYSVDGHRLAVGGDSSAISIWDVATTRPVTSLEGHSGNVRTVAFSPDSHYVASGSLDRTVRLWETH